MSKAAQSVVTRLYDDAVAACRKPVAHNQAALSLGLTAVFFIIFFLVFTVRYHTGDDVGMYMRVAGISKVEEASTYLINSHHILGFALKSLYAAFPAIDWYPLFLILCHYLSCVVIIYTILRFRADIGTLLICCGFLIVVPWYFLSELSFTTTAGMSAIAAMAATCLYLLKTPQKTIDKFLLLLLIITLFMVSVILREKSFLLIACLAGLTSPVLIWTQLTKKRLMTGAAIGIGVLLLGGLFIQADRQVYQQDPEWAEFWTQKKIKSRFVEFGHMVYNKEHQSEFETCGVTSAEFSMMRYWFFDTRTDNFSIEALQCLDSAFPKVKPDLRWDRIWDRTLSLEQPRFSFYLMMAGLFALGALSQRALAGLAITPFILILSFNYFEIFLKPAPERIAALMLSFFVVYALLLYAIQQPWLRGKSSRILRLAGVAILLSLIALHLDFLSGKSREARANHEMLAKFLEEYRETDPGLYILWTGSAVPVKHIRPFSTVRYQLDDFQHVGIGSGLNTPLTRQKLDRFGIRNIYLDIIDNPDVSLVFKNADYADIFLGMYDAFLTEQYNLKVCFDSRSNTGGYITTRVLKGQACPDS